MSTSKPPRPSWHLGIVGGIPLLALALSTGDATERNAPAVATRKPAAPATAGPVDASRARARSHDPCCSDEPPVPRARVAEPATGTRVMRATDPTASPSRTVSDDRRGGARLAKRPKDGRIPPRSKTGEQRRGGVGALIGITFA